MIPVLILIILILKIFVTWYCKKLQNLLYFQSQVIFVSFQDCHQSMVEIRQGGAEKNTFLLNNFNPYLGLFNRKKTSQWPCRFLFQLSNCLSGKILFRFSTLEEICTAVLFGWMDSMYKVTEKRSSTNTQNYWVRTKELFDT